MAQETKRIGICLNIPGVYCTQAIAGFYRFARTHPEWRISHFSFDKNLAGLKRTLYELNPDAIFTDSPDVLHICDNIFNPCPCYVLFENINPQFPKQNGITLNGDNRTIGQIAAKKLHKLGYRTLAYVDPVRSVLSTPRPSKALMWRYTRLRGGAFLRAAKDLGCATAEFKLSPRTESKAHQRLIPWLASLPKPCGILAYSDEDAVSVLSACRDAGLNVPRQVGIIGVDNDESLCENVTPTLSSIEPACEQAGFLAAEAIEAMTSGIGAMVGVKRTFGVTRVVDRQSALSILSSDSRAAAARALVSKDPAHAPTPPEIARQLGISARLLEIACRDALGHSLNTEILDQRLALAQKLLRSTQLPIGEVAARSGFNSATAFRASFQRRFGTSPRSWRATEGSNR